MSPFHDLPGRPPRTARWLVAAALGLCGLQAQAQVQSVRLADVIRSSGSGTINLLLGSGNAPISPAQLEPFRLDHTDTTGGTPRNYLSFGVDVNENSEGLESADARTGQRQPTRGWPWIA